jgi:2,6-dihydroxypyridine 3-monooxygenase
VVESQLAADAVGLLRDAISYCVLPDGHLLSYPIPSADGSLEPGSRNVNWVWYRNVASGTAFDALMTDTTGTRRAGSLAAGAVREEALVELRAHGERTLPAPVAQMVQRTANPFVQAVVEVAVPRMAFGRIALIGDAAFVLRPHIAAGTAKAADDAQTLSHCLARQPEDVPGALRRWETSQLVLGRAAMERSARAGARAQFEASWKIGEPLPFGLHVEGDSRMT